MWKYLFWFDLIFIIGFDVIWFDLIWVELEKCWDIGITIGITLTLTIHMPYVAHRAFTELCHPVLSLTADLACPHVFHPAGVYTSKVIFGPPCFLLPCSVHVSTVLQLLSDSCLSVWPMNFHLLLFISVFHWFTPVLGNGSVLQRPTKGQKGFFFLVRLTLGVKIRKKIFTVPKNTDPNFQN